MRRLWGLISLCWLCVAQAEEAVPPKTEHMAISFVDHPYIVQHILPVLEDAYAELNIGVEFVKQPSKRNLSLLSKGLMDGDAAYSDLLISGYDNVMTVGPAFLDSIFVLLCHPGVTCSQNVLFDSEKLVVITDASRDGVLAVFGNRVNAQLYSINSLDRIPKLIDGERVNYGVYVFTQSGLGSTQYPHLGSVELFKTKTYHVLHMRHAHLETDLDRAIRHALKRRIRPQP